MLAYALMGLSIWAIYIFIIDVIIAPTIHEHLRNRAFAIRDRVRRAKIQDPTISAEVFELAEEFANATVNMIPRATIGMFVRAKTAYKRIPELRESVLRDRRILAECGNKEILQAISDMNYRLTQATVVNSSNWSPVVIPLFLIFKALNLVKRLKWFADQAQVLMRIIVLRPVDAKLTTC